MASGRREIACSRPATGHSRAHICASEAAAAGLWFTIPPNPGLLDPAAPPRGTPAQTEGGGHSVSPVQQRDGEPEGSKAVLTKIYQM